MENKKEKVFVFRMTRNEERALQAMAALEGRNPSEMAREAVREAAKARGISSIGELNQQHEPTRETA